MQNFIIIIVIIWLYFKIDFVTDLNILIKIKQDGGGFDIVLVFIIVDVLKNKEWLSSDEETPCRALRQEKKERADIVTNNIYAYACAQSYYLITWIIAHKTSIG